jgi:hypothetical protein
MQHTTLCETSISVGIKIPHRISQTPHCIHLPVSQWCWQLLSRSGTLPLSSTWFDSLLKAWGFSWF